MLNMIELPEAEWPSIFCVGSTIAVSGFFSVKDQTYTTDPHYVSMDAYSRWTPYECIGDKEPGKGRCRNSVNSDDDLGFCRKCRIRIGLEPLEQCTS